MSARLPGAPRVLREAGLARRFLEAWNAGVPRALLAARFEVSLPACSMIARALRARGEAVHLRPWRPRVLPVLALIALLSGPAWGHPGRLDEQSRRVRTVTINTFRPITIHAEQLINITGKPLPPHGSVDAAGGRKTAMVTAATIDVIQRQELESRFATTSTAPAIGFNDRALLVSQVISFPATLTAIRFAPNQMPPIVAIALLARQFYALEVDALIMAAKKTTKFAPSIPSGNRTSAAATTSNRFLLEHGFGIAVATGINSTSKLLKGDHRALPESA